MSSYYIGVDVGTGSVRAALVSEAGSVLKKATLPIKIHNPKQDYYEQSSEDIWSSVCRCVASVVDGFSSKDEIRGIGFDATCSLVAIGEDGNGLSLNGDDEQCWDIIMWMDHRASRETELINSLGHPVLQNVGGKISVEMQTPKLLWIKNNLGDVWSKAKYFFDLADFLTWRATGRESKVRSLCTTVCKWTYQGKEGSWNKSFFQQLGLLQELGKNDFEKIGSTILSPGECCGYLDESSLLAMGLSANQRIPVAVSMIDAHAGVLGLLATKQARAKGEPENQLGLICGTSSCHMALSREPIQVPGVWGPYFSAILPNFYTAEGGQSAVGSLLDHVLKSHVSFESASAEASSLGIPVQQYLEKVLEEIRGSENAPNVSLLTRDLHVWPDFHGNRSPVADPTLRGVMCGLAMDTSVRNLALIYLATLQSVAYGTKHIVQQMESFGHKISVVTICGGLSQSRLFVQTHADVLGLSLILPNETESVLLGAAMLGAAASEKVEEDRETGLTCSDSTLESVIRRMEGEGQEFRPDLSVAKYHEAKFQVFLEMLSDQLKYRTMMN